MAEFDQAAPGVKKLRDALVHFDDYALGKGRMQRSVETSALGLERQLGGHVDEQEQRFRIETYTMGVNISPTLPTLRVEVVGAAKAAVHVAETAIGAIGQSS